SEFAASIDLAAPPGGGLRVYGADFVDHSGFAVAGAGDVNGDGIDDLLIGAPGRYDGYYGGCHCSDPGSAYVVFGRRGLSGSVDLSSLLVTDGFRIAGFGEITAGFSVGAAGDFNSDGV